jgi:predicted HicB family RNase H-like nuclease
MNKDARLHLRLPAKLHKRLKAMAKDCQLSVSELVVSKMEDEVARHEEKKSFIQDAEQV